MEYLKPSRILLVRIITAAMFIVILVIMSMPGKNSAAFRELSGGPEKLDMRFGYTADDAYTLFQALGDADRIFYIRFLCLDFLFIACFALVQDSLLRLAMGNVMVNSRWCILLVLPLLRGACDIVENCLILFLLSNFPSITPILASLSGAATQIKFIMLGFWLAAIPVTLAVRLTAGIRKKRGLIS